MKKTLLLFIFIPLVCFGQNIPNVNNQPKTQALDTLTNVYINYSYQISIDAPDNWIVDYGIGEDCIFRGNERELALTFSIVVKKIKMENKNAWQEYILHKPQKDEELRNFFKNQFNSEINNYKAIKSYVNNFVSLNESFDFIVRSTELEYINQFIQHTVFKDGYVYVFNAQMPKTIYDEQPEYFKNLFNLIRFLPKDFN